MTTPRSAKKTTVRQQAALLQRRAMALDLYKQGGSYAQIAETLKQQPGIDPKYDERAAYSDVQDELNRIRTELHENAELIIIKQLHQIRALMASLWGFATQGDLATVDRVRLLMRDERELFNIGANAGGKSVSAKSTTIADETSGQTLTIREVVVQLSGVDSPTPSMIDVTPPLPGT